MRWDFVWITLVPLFRINYIDNYTMKIHTESIVVFGFLYGVFVYVLFSTSIHFVLQCFVLANKDAFGMLYSVDRWKFVIMHPIRKIRYE